MQAMSFINRNYSTFVQKMNKKLIFFLFLILEQHLAHSQILKGIIKDIDNFKTIPYVNVSFSSKEIGTSTNTSGRFILNLDKIKEDRLYVSSIGYTPKYINIPNQNKSDTIYITILLKKLRLINLEQDIANTVMVLLLLV
jgi:hypothetical protein